MAFLIPSVYATEHTHMSSPCRCTRSAALDLVWGILCVLHVFSPKASLFCDFFLCFGVFSLVCFELSLSV